LQRKPANRLGLRGAQEAREHSWLKYFPWKDLYEKKIESPFIPKSGDNFDAKYCNAPDKIGNNTKEKYDRYLRDETYKDAFRDFYYYYNENDDNDKNNTPEKKFTNPHLYYTGTTRQQLTNESEGSYHTRNSNYERSLGSTISVEDKFSKIKNMSHSSSSNTLLRHYRNSSVGPGGGTTSNSTASSSSLYMHRKSGSTTNFNY
jgi:hypothetical protein